jgi:hypothetical protein
MRFSIPPGKPPIIYRPEFLLLVNGQDDNSNGWIDEGWDGVDNNGDGNIDELAEWETERWTGPYVSQAVLNEPYAIKRRPAAGPNAREVALPTQVVIDLTTWSTSRERSRLPVNPFTGSIDILVNPDGTAVPATIYSTPASSGMSASFLHFWLAERGDLAAPSRAVSSAPFLPLPQGMASVRFGGAEIKGEYRLVTLFARNGLVTTNENMPFDQVPDAGSAASYNPSVPFLPAQQGIAGRP